MCPQLRADTDRLLSAGRAGRTGRRGRGRRRRLCPGQGSGANTPESGSRRRARVPTRSIGGAQGPDPDPTEERGRPRGSREHTEGSLGRGRGPSAGAGWARLGGAPRWSPGVGRGAGEPASPRRDGRGRAELGWTVSEGDGAEGGRPRDPGPRDEEGERRGEGPGGAEGSAGRRRGWRGPRWGRGAGKAPGGQRGPDCATRERAGGSRGWGGWGEGASRGGCPRAQGPAAPASCAPAPGAWVSLDFRESGFTPSSEWCPIAETQCQTEKSGAREGAPIPPAALRGGAGRGGPRWGAREGWGAREVDPEISPLGSRTSCATY